MKLIVRNHIEILKEKQSKVEKYLTQEMLNNKKERKLWISGQNL